MSAKQRVADHWTILTIQRCPKQERWETGVQPCKGAVAMKLPTHYAYRCTVCGRTYPAHLDFAYRDHVWVADS